MKIALLRKLLVAVALAPALACAQGYPSRPDNGIGWPAVKDTNKPQQSLDALSRMQDRLRPETAGHTVRERAACRSVYAARAEP